MLILTRKLREEIVIGRVVRVTITDINWVDKSVRLGIEAPRKIEVHRKEILDKIEREEERKKS